ncbi:hypothetical protein GUJ93_ZPchr0009g1185 [Zizania palustris]|uniref:Uncharacterized protein n=1 Tax=Zizania palustris TaxID=103762 RepID=A0A8J5RHF7_ZIZPA|nr:hypothetical protein GUJ93_ZPchr0009g1185 [Zizania palustris]
MVKSGWNWGQSACVVRPSRGVGEEEHFSAGVQKPRATVCRLLTGNHTVPNVHRLCSGSSSDLAPTDEISPLHGADFEGMGVEWNGEGKKTELMRSAGESSSSRTVCVTPVRAACMPTAHALHVPKNRTERDGHCLCYASRLVLTLNPKLLTKPSTAEQW